MFLSLLVVPLVGLLVLCLIRMFLTNFAFYRVLGLSLFIFHFMVSLLVCYALQKQTLYSPTILYLYIERYVISTSFNIVVSFSLDGFSACFLLLSSFVFITCGVSFWRRSGDVFGFLCLLLWLQFFVSGFFFVQDLLFLYVFFEAAIIPMYLLIGRWGSGAARVIASYYFLMYTVVGSALMLYAISSIHLALGTTSFEVLAVTDFSYATNVFYFWVFFLGFAVKVPLFPVHLWLPEAHVQAPTEGSVLLSAVLLKMGVYGIYKVCFGFFSLGSYYFAPVVRGLAIVGVLYSSCAAFVQLDIKRIIAYSSVAHTNLAVLGMFSFTVEGVHGALLMSVAHGLVSAGLFYLVGFLYDRHNTRNITVFGGLTNVMPLYCCFFFILMLCNSGMPLSLNFLGEFLIFTGLFKQGVLLCLLASTSVVLVLIYSFWLYLRIALGALETSYIKNFFDLTKVEFFILLPFIFFLLVLGVYPAPLLALLLLV